MLCPAAVAICRMLFNAHNPTTTVAEVEHAVHGADITEQTKPLPPFFGKCDDEPTVVQGIIPLHTEYLLSVQDSFHNTTALEHQ
jgi:hypothetical protein